MGLKIYYDILPWVVAILIGLNVLGWVHSSLNYAYSFITDSEYKTPGWVLFIFKYIDNLFNNPEDPDYGFSIFIVSAFSTILWPIALPAFFIFLLLRNIRNYVRSIKGYEEPEEEPEEESEESILSPPPPPPVPSEETENYDNDHIRKSDAIELLKHIDNALKMLESRDMKYSNIWDQLIACKDHLREYQDNGNDEEKKSRYDIIAN